MQEFELANKAFEIAKQVHAGLVETVEDHACIFAAAKLIVTLKKNGIRAFPLSVAVRLIGAENVAIGHTSKPIHEAEWNGHLVVIAPNLYGARHGLFDLAISQATRFGIQIGPQFLEVPNEFVTGQIPHLVQGDHCKFGYLAMLEDKSFEGAPDWKKWMPDLPPV